MGFFSSAVSGPDCRIAGFFIPAWISKGQVFFGDIEACMILWASIVIQLSALSCWACFAPALAEEFCDDGVAEEADIPIAPPWESGDGAEGMEKMGEGLSPETGLDPNAGTE